MATRQGLPFLCSAKSRNEPRGRPMLLGRIPRRPWVPLRTLPMKDRCRWRRRTSDQGDLHRLRRKSRRWYDFYVYAAFALYFAGAFFPNAAVGKVLAAPRADPRVGWRIPFVIEAALEVVAAVMRRRCMRPRFMKLPSRSARATAPQALLRYPREVMLVAGLTAEALPRSAPAPPSWRSFSSCRSA
jgi:hypothetical protein